MIPATHALFQVLKNHITPTSASKTASEASAVKRFWSVIYYWPIRSIPLLALTAHSSSVRANHAQPPRTQPLSSEPRAFLRRDYLPTCRSIALGMSIQTHHGSSRASAGPYQSGSACFAGRDPIRAEVPPSAPNTSIASVASLSLLRGLTRQSTGRLSAAGYFCVVPHRSPSAFLSPASISELAAACGFQQSRVLAAATRCAPQAPAVIEALHDNIAGESPFAAAFAIDKSPGGRTAFPRRVERVVHVLHVGLHGRGVDVDAHGSSQCGPPSPPTHSEAIATTQTNASAHQTHVGRSLIFVELPPLPREIQRHLLLGVQ